MDGANKGSMNNEQEGGVGKEAGEKKKPRKRKHKKKTKKDQA